MRRPTWNCLRANAGRGPAYGLTPTATKPDPSLAGRVKAGSAQTLTSCLQPALRRSPYRIGTDMVRTRASLGTIQCL
jgi:hypothetical protein